MRWRRIRLNVRGLMVLVAIAAVGFAIVVHRLRTREQWDRLAQISHHQRQASWYRRELNHRVWFEGRAEAIQLFEKSAAWHDEQARRLRRGGGRERPRPAYAPDHDLAIIWFNFHYSSNTGLQRLRKNDYMNSRTLLVSALRMAKGLDVDEAELLELSEGLAVATRGDQFTQHRRHAKLHHRFLEGREWYEGRPDLIRLFEKVMAWHEEQALRIERGGRLDDPNRDYDDDPDHSRLMHWEAFLWNKDEGLEWLRKGRYDSARTFPGSGIEFGRGPRRGRVATSGVLRGAGGSEPGRRPNHRIGHAENILPIAPTDIGNHWCQGRREKWWRRGENGGAEGDILISPGKLGDPGKLTGLTRHCSGPLRGR